MNEKESVERELREKETRILNMLRQIEDLNNDLDESTRVRQQQKNELDDLMSSKDDFGKNVMIYH